MEAVKPKRRNHKKQQARKKSYHADTASEASDVAAAANVQVEQAASVDGQDKEQGSGSFRTTRSGSGASTSSENADDGRADSAEAELMRDMIAAMEEDIEQLSSGAADATSATTGANGLMSSTLAEIAGQEEEEDVAVTDREIAQNEDDLWSLLGAVPTSIESPSATPQSSSEQSVQLPSQLPLDNSDTVPAVRGGQADAAELTGSAVPTAAEHTEAKTWKHSAVRLDQAQIPSSLEPEIPSAPAFDDAFESYAPPGMLAGAMTESAASAPSAPSFNDSDDENSSPATFETLQAESLQVEPPRSYGLQSDTAVSRPDDSEQVFSMPQVSSGATAGLMVASAAFPDSSPSGHRVATPSAPPEIDLNEPLAVETVDLTPSAPSMPSLSPPSAKTISRVSNPSAPQMRKPVESDEKSSAVTGNVGHAVRTSFAKARMQDAGRNLYPSVPQEVQSVRPGSSSFARISADGQVVANAVEAARQQRVHIKLDPFVNFEMTLMRAEASQKRQEMKMQRIETNKGELHSRLERYLYSEYLLHTAASTLESSKKEIDTLVKKGASQLSGRDCVQAN